MEKSLRLVRWIFFLPLGFLASVLIGFLATTITEFIGGASWWVWLVSGAAPGGAFIVISFIVAPEKNKFTKWATFSIGGEGHILICDYGGIKDVHFLVKVK